MMHNNNNRNNNNRRFSKNNNFKKRRFSSSNSSSGGSGNYNEDQQISPQQRRNFENKRDTHLTKAKEYLSAGERIEAENHFQHADHYHRMAIMGLDKIQQQQAQAAQEDFSAQNLGAQQTNDDSSSGQYQEQNYDDIPEIPVDMMGRFPAENNQPAPRNFQRNEGRNYGRNNNRGRDRVSNNEPESAVSAPAETNNLGALPFMQIQLKDNPEV